MRKFYFSFIYFLILGCHSEAPKELFKAPKENDHNFSLFQNPSKKNKIIYKPNLLINNKNVNLMLSNLDDGGIICSDWWNALTRLSTVTIRRVGFPHEFGIYSVGIFTETGTHFSIPLFDRLHLNIQVDD